MLPLFYGPPEKTPPPNPLPQRESGRRVLRSPSPPRGGGHGGGVGAVGPTDRQPHLTRRGPGIEPKSAPRPGRAWQGIRAAVFPPSPPLRGRGEQDFPAARNICRARRHGRTKKNAPRRTTRVRRGASGTGEP